MSNQKSKFDFSSAGHALVHAHSFVPSLITLIGLLVTFGIWQISNRDITSSAQARFDVRAAQIVTAVEQRMQAYEQILRGGVGLFRTAATIDRRQWHEYVENANMSKNYPGIQSMTVDFPIAATQKQAHIATIRAEGHADYNILPELPERPIYHSLVFVEPFAGRNLRAFGFDMYTNEVRRKAMDRAIDSGLPSMSGMVKLAQETNQNAQHGFIYCLPVYRTGSPADTTEHRRASLRALVCGGFRTDDLMQGIFGNSNSDLELEIFDESMTPTSQVYDSRHGDESTTSKFSRTTSAEIGGHIWQLRISANQAYGDSVSFTQSRLVAVAGVTLSSLLFGLVLSMLNTRLHARRIAVTLHSIGDAVVATDSEGRVTLLNPLAEKLTGWRQNEAIGMPVDEVIRTIHALTRLPVVNPVGDVLTYGTAHSLAKHTLMVARDGSECAITDSCAPILDGKGKASGAVLVFRDVTDEYAAQRALRDQQFYTRSLLEASIDALMTTDPAGTISDVNKQMEALTGCTREELIGASFKNYFTDQDRAAAGIRQVLRDNRLTDYELTARSSSGRETEVSYNATTFYDRAGKLQGVFAAARDITERKRLEQSLQEKNVALEHASHMKSEFLANMSHELRTPLNAIIGFSEVLKDGLLGELLVQQQDYVNDIFKSGTHLLSLINDILDLSKVEAGKMTLDLEQLEVATLVQESMLVVREKALVHHIAVVIDVPDTLAGFGTIWLDARKVKQILYNLLSNAVKFTPDGGTLTLRARRVESAAVPGGSYPHYLELMVRDTGIGISTADQERLFRPFSQIDSSLARRYQGTGLGLVMVQHLAVLHGGKVALHSVQGQGATFTVWLPWRDSELALADGARQRLPLSNVVPEVQLFTTTGTLPLALVIEDDDNAAELLRVQLESIGFRVERAGTGEAALALAERVSPDLVTLDINLPGINGWAFLQSFRQLPQFAKIPVVIVSIVADRSRGLSLGASQVLQKPVGHDALVRALHAMGFPCSSAPPKTLLVIDDDPKVVQLLANYLTPVGFNLLSAFGGQEGIDAARRKLPDLIVLDLMMPEVSGFDVVEALKLDPITASIPIIILTAQSIDAKDRALLGTKVQQVMEKSDFKHDQCVNEVRLAMAHRGH
jgi:PAS domain S-box-containing protein